MARKPTKQLKTYGTNMRIRHADKQLIARIRKQHDELRWFSDPQVIRLVLARYLEKR